MSSQTFPAVPMSRSVKNGRLRTLELRSAKKTPWRADLNFRSTSQFWGWTGLLKLNLKSSNPCMLLVSLAIKDTQFKSTQRILKCGPEYTKERKASEIACVFFI